MSAGGVNQNIFVVITMAVNGMNRAMV